MADPRTVDEYLTEKKWSIAIIQEGHHLYNALSHLRHEIERIAATATAPRRPLRLEFLDIRRFGAGAGSFADADLIYLPYFIDGLLRGAFRCLLSHPYVLSDNVNPSVEQPPLHFARAPDQISSSIAGWDVGELADPHREMLANYLTDKALLLIGLHEFRHIWNGHVDYVQGAGSLSLMTETDMESGDKLPKINRQTLEWDADIAACQSLLEITLSMKITTTETGFSLWNLPDYYTLRDLKGGLEAVIVTISVLYLFMETSQVGTSTDPNNANHPPARERMLYSLTFVAYCLNERSAFKTDVVMPILYDAMARFSQAWRETIGLDSPLPRSEDPEFMAKHSARYQAMEQCWREMYSDLDRLKRGGKLADREPRQ